MKNTMLTLLPRAFRPGLAPRAPGLRIGFSEDHRTLFIEGRLVAQCAFHPDLRRDLVDRLFSLPQLRTLRLEWKQGRARLNLALSDVSRSEILEALAFALRQPNPHRLALPHQNLLDEPAVEVRRLDSGITFWRIDFFTKTHYRLAHPFLSLQSVRHSIEQELETLPEVERVTWSNLGGGSFHLQVKPHRLDTAHLIEILDAVLAELPAAQTLTDRQAAVRDALITTNLVLSPVADFLFPPLGYVNTLLVLALNAHHWRPAFHSLERGKVGLHAMYLVIGALTLITFEFLPAALMYALMIAWPRVVRDFSRQHQSNFLRRFERRPRRVWLEHNSALIETRVEALPAHNVVVLSAGDLVPGDGVMLSGHASVDTRWITGQREPQHPAPGASLYATSRIVTGDLKMRVNAIGPKSTAGQRALWYRAAFRKEKAVSPAKTFAEKAAFPILAVTLLAGFRGGAHMAKATIRPDYVTGPVAAEDLLRLTSILRAAGEGIILEDTTELDKLLAPDCLVLDESVNWPDFPGSLAEKLGPWGVSDVVLLSGEASPQAAEQARRLGITRVQSYMTTDMKREFIYQRQLLGHCVLYAGNTAQETELAAQADMAISILPFPEAGLDRTPALLQPEWQSLLRLFELAHELARERVVASRLAWVPNVAASLGAIYLHAPAHASVLITNLGTLANFTRYASALQALNPKL